MNDQYIYIHTPVSDPPKEDGTYMTKWTGVPAFTEKEFKDGEWQARFYNTGLLTHWLKPILKTEYDRQIAEKAWTAAMNREMSDYADLDKDHKVFPDKQTYLNSL